MVKNLLILCWQCILPTFSIITYTFAALGEEIPTINHQGLSPFSSAKAVEPTPEILRLSEMPSVLTSAKYLLLPRNQNFVSQLSPTTIPVVLVTDVKVNTKDKGIEVILVTSNSEKLSVLAKTEGNSYIANIPHARLQLRDEKSFQQSMPVPGIARVTVANTDADTLRVTVTGDKGAPAVELFDSQTEGLVFGVTPNVTTGQQPRPEKKPDIQLEVTGKPDTGYSVPDATTGTRTDTPNRDIPQTVNVIPRQVIEDQGANRLSDVLRNLGLTSAGSSRFFDDPIIRGFQVMAQDTLKNGLRDNFTGQYNGENLANVERVEVLKGPASVLYGNAAPGGLYNVITKQPLSEPYYSIEGKVGSYARYKSSIDLSGPLSTDKKLLYRFNGDYQNLGSFVDDEYRERIFLAPVISWQPNRNTKLTLEGEYKSERSLELFPIPLPVRGTLRPNPNGKIPLNRYLGDPTIDGSKTTVTRISYNFEHNVSNHLTLYNTFRYAFTNEPYSNAVGIRGLQTDNRTLARSFTRRLPPYEATDFSQDTHVVGKFKTGSLKHQLLVGVDWYQLTQPSSSESIGYTFPSIDIYSPVYGQKPGKITSDFKLGLRREQLGVYIQDLLALGDHLKLLLGGRFDSVELSSNGVLAGSRFANYASQSAFSPRFGIVYQPIKPISLYASYSRSFQPFTGTDFKGNLFEPTRGTQYEVGVKTDLLNNKLSTTLALYQLTESNIATADPDPAHVGYSIQIGEQRSRGVELFVTGELAPGWNVIGSYNYTDPRVTRDNTYKVGNLLVNTPFNSVSLWTTYIVPNGRLKGFGGGVSVFYIGDREGDLQNSLKLPSYVRIDAALYYRNNNYQAALNFKNLFDVLYFDASGGSSYVFRGEPFGVELSLKWQF